MISSFLYKFERLPLYQWNPRFKHHQHHNLLSINLYVVSKIVKLYYINGGLSECANCEI